MTFAAMDTTSNALSSILHLLSMHPEAQERLRKEIRDARNDHHGDLDYDTLTALPYLEAVCRETLRLQVDSLIKNFLQNLTLNFSGIHQRRSCPESKFSTYVHLLGCSC